MITEVHAVDPPMQTALAACHYGRKMLICIQAYGTQYSFCRFFRLSAGEKTAWMMLQNSTMLISSQDDFTDMHEAITELQWFLTMHRPFRIEGCQSLVLGLELDGYQMRRRSIFRLEPLPVSPVFRPEEINCEPRLDDVYEILQEGFPNLIAHDLWLTDTSHMVRRGLRKCYTYCNVTVATAVYEYEKQVLIGQVATKAAARGKGYARDFLHWIACDLARQGKIGILYALDLRAGFYREIGFTLLGTEQVWERLDAEPDAKRKEAL